MNDAIRAWASAALLLCGVSSGCAAEPAGAPGMCVTMAAKLRHAQATLAAVVRADFGAIEAGADALRTISADTMTMPQDTVAYGVMADRFREVAGDLAAKAAAEDLEGVTASYLELTRTCVDCHRRINRERMVGDFPGPVSQRAPSLLDALEEAGS